MWDLEYRIVAPPVKVKADITAKNPLHAQDQIRHQESSIRGGPLVDMILQIDAERIAAR